MNHLNLLILLSQRRRDNRRPLVAAGQNAPSRSADVDADESLTAPRRKRKNVCDWRRLGEGDASPMGEINSWSERERESPSRGGLWGLHGGGGGSGAFLQEW